VTFRLGVLGAMYGLLCGCGNLPEPYAPPSQRPFFEGAPETARILNMADGGVENHFLQDIDAQLQGNTWRWTGKRPTLRLRPGSNQKVAHSLAYSIDFVIAGSTLEQTGPVTLSFFVNDHLLDRVRYATPGQRHFEKPVPAEWLAPGADATLAAEVDKVWKAPPPSKVTLGFILVAFGFEQLDLERRDVERRDAERK
jgi:hypothetical protein